MKMSENKLFLHDVRLQERFISDGTLESEAQKKHLDSLPDLADQCEEFDLEQPALAKEQVEPPAPALPEAAPPPAAPVATFVQPVSPPAEASAPVQPPAPAPPAPAASSFAAAPQAPPPQAAPPAAEPVSVPPASTEHGPASIPPPTASVDADWGDS
jgi:hypothetical protein